MATKGRTHRPAGDGSIYQRRSDGRWVAAITVLGHGQKYLYARTKEEARQKLREALRKQEQGLPVTVKRQTVAQYLDQWLEDAVRPSVRPRTYASYAQMVRLHVKPALGHHQLAQLTPQHVQAFIKAKSASRSQKSGAPLAPRTVNYLRAILRQALNQAVKWDLVTRNVAQPASPVRAEQRKARRLTADECRALLIAARGDRLEALYVVTLAAGLRQGEALGLEWSDVDLDRGTLTLRTQLQRIDGQYELDPLKTDRSLRALPLLPLAVDVLRGHRARQNEERLVAGSTWQNDRSLIFTTRQGAPLNARVAVSNFKALLKRADVPDITFHGLRHSCASLLAYLNVHPSVIQAILGHSTSRLTMDVYTHVDPSMLRDAADRMQRLLSVST